MKTKKRIMLGVTALATMMLITISSAYAYGGMGGGQNQGQGKGMGKGQGQMMQDGKQGGHSHNPSELIEGIELQDLSTEEKNMLSYGYSEEMLARDMYNYFYELYGVKVFDNISSSESEHMQAVKILLDRYELDIPNDYGELSETYEALKTEGSESLQKALEVGIKIEMLDIEDIAESIKLTDNDDLKIIFTNIGGASYNHLRGFLKALNNNGLETDIDYSDYLSEEEINSKGGTLKSKMAERLELEGVELPEQASAKNILANCDKENMGNQKLNKGRDVEMKKSSNAKFLNSARGNSLKNKYSGVMKEKYNERVNNLGNSTLINILDKIDALQKEVSTSDNYEEKEKEHYIAILDSLRDMIVDKISDK